MSATKQTLTLNWKPDRPLSVLEYNYLIDLLQSVQGQLTSIKKRIQMTEQDLETKIREVRSLPRESLTKEESKHA